MRGDSRAFRFMAFPISAVPFLGDGVTLRVSVAGPAALASRYPIPPTTRLLGLNPLSADSALTDD